MVYNFQGIAISKNYASIEDLTTKLGIPKITQIGVSNFQNVTSSNMEDNELYATVLDIGTILTFGLDLDIQMLYLDEVSKDGSALRFLISESSQVYALEYILNGVSERTIMVAEGENKFEQGKPLEYESDNIDIQQLILKIIGEVVGQNFSSIEPEKTSTRFSV